ncbi:MAG: hypothetical protein AAF488_14705 [Planctomycetota bacterium]
MVRTALIGILLAAALQGAAMLCLVLGRGGPCGPTDSLAIAGLVLHLPSIIATTFLAPWLPSGETGQMIFSQGVQVAYFSCITIPLIPPARTLRAHFRRANSEECLPDSVGDAFP